MTQKSRAVRRSDRRTARESVLSMNSPRVYRPHTCRFLYCAPGASPPLPKQLEKISFVQILKKYIHRTAPILTTFVVRDGAMASVGVSSSARTLERRHRVRGPCFPLSRRRHGGHVRRRYRSERYGCNQIVLGYAVYNYPRHRRTEPQRFERHLLRTVSRPRLSLGRTNVHTRYLVPAC